MNTKLCLIIAAICLAACSAVQVQRPIAHAQADADAWARLKLRQMTLDERLGLLLGFIPGLMPAAERTPGMAMGAGYVKGLPRLDIPPLSESDASLGVANQGGIMRGPDVATALPSGAAMAATWNPQLIERGGAMIGSEARAKGINVLLAGGVNLVREPRNGRNFEYLGEDPLLAGTLAGHAIRGVQSNHIISTIKHYLLNAQETNRGVLDVSMDEAAMRESDLLAFEIGIEIGSPGSVMCAYNRVNGTYACDNSFLLTDVLRRDWGYPGWVMSDWGAVHSVSIRAGLDQESGTRPKQKTYFGDALRDQLAAGKVTVEDIDRSVSRILRTMYASGVVDHPVKSGEPIDYGANGAVAQQLAEQGIVLLKNARDLLPIAATTQRILLVGGHADVGVLGGGGSSQVNPVGGAALALPIPGDAAIYHRRMYAKSSPLLALREQLPDASISYDDGTDAQRAATAARAADLVLVFAEQFTAEGKDVPSLALPDQQDALIEAVAAANARTAVILETGGPVLMPWIGQVGAVIEAWYPGQRGGHALANLLTGKVNPSGRLPITFPAAIEQTPNPVLPGSNRKPVSDSDGGPPPVVTYPEGADVGYRWYERTRASPLFAFGYGLSYTRFAYQKLAIEPGPEMKISFAVSNIGARAGSEVAQVYARVGGVRRLIGWSRVELRPGESRTVTVVAEPRVLAAFDVKARQWHIAAGTYDIEVSAAVNQPQLSGQARLAARQLKP